MRQYDAIRQLVREHGLNPQLVKAEMAHGLQQGQISWESNSYGLTAHQYACMLWDNYIERGRL
jgi:hypothetical protein